MQLRNEFDDHTGEEKGKDGTNSSVNVVLKYIFSRESRLTDERVAETNGEAPSRR
jgi:hypothetical protein